MNDVDLMPTQYTLNKILIIIVVWITIPVTFAKTNVVLINLLHIYNKG